MASFVANGMIFLVFTIFRRFLAWKPFTIIATAPYAVSKVDAEVSNQKEKLLNYMIGNYNILCHEDFVFT